MGCQDTIRLDLCRKDQHNCRWAKSSSQNPNLFPWPIGQQTFHQSSGLDEDKIEDFGIASKNKALSKNDEKALEILQSTTRFKDGHYEIGLLWKENATLPTNRWLTEKQLQQLKAKLSTKPVLREKYEETLEKDLQNGYVVKSDPCTDNTLSVSYLPHHPVSNENKPGKIWRVTNASSIFQGQSLNSNLSKGPDLLSNLVGIILRFQESHIAISSDIEQMFMQVKVAPSDRSYLRFLWDRNGKIEEYEYTSHIFGATSSPCIASYALRRSAKDNQKHFPEVSLNAISTWTICRFPPTTLKRL